MFWYYYEVVLRNQKKLFPFAYIEATVFGLYANEKRTRILWYIVHCKKELNGDEKVIIPLEIVN